MLNIISIWLLYGYCTSAMNRFEFTKLATQTFDQHYNLRKFGTACHHKNFTTTFKCLKLDSPFSYSDIDSCGLHMSNFQYKDFLNNCDIDGFIKLFMSKLEEADHICLQMRQDAHYKMHITRFY